MKISSHVGWTIVTVVLMVCIIGALGFFDLIYGIATGKYIGERGNDGTGIYVVLAHERRSIAAYDDLNAKMAGEANSDAARVAASAWLACSHSKQENIGNGRIQTLPTNAELNACEVQAVSLASSRGFDQKEASQFIQALRVLLDPLRENAVGTTGSEQEGRP